MMCGLSCSDPGQKACPEVCPRGETCDDSRGVCEPAALSKFVSETTPGKNVRLAARDERVFVTMFEPSNRSILAGEMNTEGANLVLLASVRSPEHRVQIATSSTRVFVVWLSELGSFELAYRNIRASNSVWTFRTMETGEAYGGTEEFDLDVDGDGNVFVAFQGTDHTLKLLSGSPDSAADFRLRSVDDGSASNNGIACPDSLRDNQDASGVGIEPSIVVGPGTLAISYFDVDCGDLRLAQQNQDGGFLIDVVDTGSFEGELAPMQRGRAGRYSSIAVDPSTGGVAVAYMDEARSRVVFASHDVTGYRIEIVDDGVELDEFARERKALVGAFTKLSFTSGGAANITYMNTSATEVLVARRPNGGSRWFGQTLSAEGLVGFSVDHVYSDESGLVVASERLNVGPDGYESTLEAIWE